MVVHTDFSNAF